LGGVSKRERSYKEFGLKFTDSLQEPDFRSSVENKNRDLLLEERQDCFERFVFYPFNFLESNGKNRSLERALGGGRRDGET